MMTIGELARATELAPSAIRYYEQEGLLPAPRRAGGRRVFDENAVPQLIFIQVAKEAGFTLEEIRQLIRSFKGERWRVLAERKLRELDEAAKRMRLMRALLVRLIDCGCFDVEACGTLLRRRANSPAPQPR